MANVSFDIPDEYLQCRDVRHAWDYHDVYTARHRDTRRKELIEQLICIRCTAIKKRYLNPSTGVPLRPARTLYPKGYLRNGQGRMTPADRGTLALIHINQARKAKEAKQ